MSYSPSQARVAKGQPGGGRFGGAPRNAQAASAQKNASAVKNANALADQQAANRTAFLKTLSDADLQALTGVVYGSPSSDPEVVAMRITVANEMARRGMDVKKFGALGGGLPASKVTPQSKKAAVQWSAKRAPAKAAVRKPAPKAAAKPTAAQTARAGSQVHSATSVRAQ